MERISADGNYLRIWEDVPEIVAFFSTKKGATTEYPFYNSDIMEDLGIADAVLVGHHQTHSTNVEVITEEMARKAAAGDGRIVFEGVDGAITDVPGVLLTTRHADCLPLFLHDARKGVCLISPRL